MIRIGLIGSESWHAFTLAKECNIPDENGKFLIDDCRVTAICGIDDNKEHTFEVAKSGNIPHIVDTPEALFPLCDAVMILMRRGGERVSYALPFLRAGYPVFLDKPVCTTQEDMDILRQEIQERNCIITGGSTVKFSPGMTEVKEYLKSGAAGRVLGMSYNDCADMNDPYDGLFFYLCHAVEVMFQTMGYDVKSVEVSALDNKNFSVYCTYPDVFANLILADCANKRFVTIYGTKTTETFYMDYMGLSKGCLLDFVDKIRNQSYITPQELEELMMHVPVVQAAIKASKEGKKVLL